MTTPDVKRLLLFGLGVGVGAVLAIAGIVAGVAWHSQRPKPWNKAAVTATFYGVDTEGERKTLLFHYLLENHTDQDYRLNPGSGVSVGFRLKKENSFSPVTESEFLNAELPIFVPAREKILYRIHLAIPYEGPQLPDDPAAKEERQRGVALFAQKEMSNTNGFDLFDGTAHYHIVFPVGW